MLLDVFCIVSIANCKSFDDISDNGVVGVDLSLTTEDDDDECTLSSLSSLDFVECFCNSKEDE